MCHRSSLSPPASSVGAKAAFAEVQQLNDGVCYGKPQFSLRVDGAWLGAGSLCHLVAPVEHGHLLQYNSMCVYYATYTQLASHKLCIGSVMNMLKRDLGTGDLCDNIGLVGISAKWSYVTASPSHHDKAIPILSPLLLPFLKFKEFLIYLSRLLF